MMANEAKRPTPPSGFVPFKWEHRILRRGKADQASVPVCPNCGAPKWDGGKWGYGWLGGGFQDPGARQTYDEFTAAGGVVIGAANPICSHDGVPILLHWSRYATGKCMECGCELWHDFVDDPDAQYPGAGWQHYYKPTQGQLALF
jgi:hypothetical protein